MYICICAPDKLSHPLSPQEIVKSVGSKPSKIYAPLLPLMPAMRYLVNLESQRRYFNKNVPVLMYLRRPPYATVIFRGIAIKAHHTYGYVCIYVCTIKNYLKGNNQRKILTCRTE